MTIETAKPVAQAQRRRDQGDQGLGVIEVGHHGPARRRAGDDQSRRRVMGGFRASVAWLGHARAGSGPAPVCKALTGRFRGRVGAGSGVGET